MSRFFENLVGLLPLSLQPYAKGLVPLAAGVALALEDLTIDAAEVGVIKSLAGGAILAALVIVFPNLGYQGPPQQ